MAYATVGVRMRRGLGYGMLAFGAMLVLAAPVGAQGVDSPVTFTKDIAPILQREVPGVPSRGVHGADVVDDLPRVAAVGPRH